MNVEISQSNRKDKRLQAKFQDKTVHFGAKGGETFADHGDQTKKEAWVARHEVRENWQDMQTAGALAKHVLWNKRTIAASIKDINRRQKKYVFHMKE
jgi:hypothetical protein